MKRIKKFHPIPSPRRLSRKPLADANPQIRNVVERFKAITDTGDYLALCTGGQFEPGRYVHGSFNNHFQGIQRPMKSDYLIVSGGDPKRGSHLFIVKMGSRRTRGGWRSNLMKSDFPPGEDRVVKAYLIDAARASGTGLWHAGGMSLSGDILAVPIERSRKGASVTEKSEIRFFDVRLPERLKPLGRLDDEGNFVPTLIRRKGAKAGAAALTKLPNGHYLAAAWSDSDSLGRRLDFYLSKGIDFTGGFAEEPVTWKDAEGPAKLFQNYQTVSFILQEPRGEEDRVGLFLAGMHNDSPAAPTLPGRDLSDLFELRFPEDILYAPNPSFTKPPEIKPRVKNKFFKCRHRQCNMDAATGLYFDRFGDLYIYCAYHWRDEETLRFNEYRPHPRYRDKITHRRQAWIDLYEHVRYRGRYLSLVGTRDADIADYGRIRAQGGDFDNKVSSVRFQIPEGDIYRLFEKPGFLGRHLDLVGDGTIREISSLKTRPDPEGLRPFNDLVSSSRYIAG